jgi:hypothetical protein
MMILLSISVARMSISGERPGSIVFRLQSITIPWFSSLCDKRKEAYSIQLKIEIDKLYTTDAKFYVSITGVPYPPYVRRRATREGILLPNIFRHSCAHEQGITTMSYKPRIPQD